MNNPNFFIDYETILDRIDAIDPPTYARTRNYLSGAVSYLSPFLTHGIISTRLVRDRVLTRYSDNQSEKFFQELGWREYFQRVWQAKGDEIFTDLRSPQEPITSTELPVAIANGTTGINVIDEAITYLQATGYMHNHARMWTASLTCNIAQTHWREPARWMHYHLLDGDLASNTLCWQWNAGSFSSKKYFANQENLNKFSETEQRGTILDVGYDQIADVPCPTDFDERAPLPLENHFPPSTAEPLRAGSALLYSIWNLDPTWRSDFTGRRVLWIEPSQLSDWPLSPQRWDFIQHWAAQISGLELFVGEAADLFPSGLDDLDLITREYPRCAHWPGSVDPRDWMFPETEGYFQSFFAYWKRAQKNAKNPAAL